VPAGLGSRTILPAARHIACTVSRLNCHKSAEEPSYGARDALRGAIERLRFSLLICSGAAATCPVAVLNILSTRKPTVSIDPQRPGRSAQSWRYGQASARPLPGLALADDEQVEQ
jgi:hypothetical protein